MDKIDLKTCNRCKIAYPATTEFFTKNSSNKSGLYSLCKKCKSKQNLQYRTENKDKKAKTDKAYYKANKEKMRNYHAKHYKENKERISLRSRKHYEENKEQIKKKTKAYARNNPEKTRKWKKKWRDNNKEQLSVKRHIKRANKAKTEHSLTLEQWEQCLDFFNYKDAYTGLSMETPSQDHIIPMSKGGPYTRDNIVPCEININCSKQDSDMEEWYRKQDYFSEKRLNRIYEWINLEEKEEQQVS